MGIVKYFFAVTIVSTCVVFGVDAQSVGSRMVAMATSDMKPLVAPIAEDKNLDSLLSLYYLQQQVDTTNMVTDFVNEGDSLHLELPDSIYIRRLQNIVSPIELSFNGVVKSYIKVYTERRKDKMEEILGLSDYYFPIFEEILDSYNMPVELRMLAVIESALNPNAVSRVGATGLWQFMYGTGRMYKLEVNSFVDARKDPIAATHAACRFLRDLQKIYGDWTLAIAAYNCGPGNVNKAIRRSGGKRDYWAIYYHLPRETRGYVPAFIAATYAYTYYKEHRLTPQIIDMPFAVDTIQVNKMLHFQQVSEMLNVPVETLEQLNPQYRRGIIPAKNKSYTLTIPQTLVSKFVDKESEIYTYKDSVFFNPKVLSVPGNFDRDVDNIPGRKRVTYRVKSGDNLGAIAERFDVRVSDLRQWNRIRGSSIRAGQKLVVFVTQRVAAQKLSDLSN